MFRVIDGMTGAYFNPKFLSHIDANNVSTILELGSRDGIDAVKLSNFYNAEVYAFECNPQAFSTCADTVEDHERVHVFNAAVWDEECKIPFYPVVNGNDGASSCFVADPSYPYEARYEQSEIIVDGIRLDGWLSENNCQPEMLCIDLQGAELRALMGMGSFIDSVKYIITEGQIIKMYDGASTISEIEEFLKGCGFSMVHEELVNEWFGDYLFIRSDA